MEIQHLKYFFAVAKAGSFTRASKSLRIQQPTISKMIRQLESDLGTQLLERHKTGVRLTPAGREVFRSCQEIFARVGEIQSLADREKKLCEGPLSFGVTDSVATYWIPVVLRQLMKVHPKILPSVFAGTSNLICNEILEGNTEFGIFFTVPSSAGFQIQELAEIPFQIVISPAHAKNPELRHRFILSRDIDYPKDRAFPTLEMLKRARIRVDSRITSNNLDSQRKMVEEGLGVAILPAFMVKESIAQGKLALLFPNRSFSYSLKLVTRKGSVLSNAANEFLKVLSQEIPALSSP